MKGYALVLLCIVVAVQARSTSVLSSSRALAGLGQQPWVVHLRVAVSTSGFLETCAGSLINERWVLSARECLSNARFIWIRYGVVRVWYPELVTENSLVSLHPEVALINVNRVVQSTANISPVALATSTEEVETTTFCAFGKNNNEPGEDLSCWTVSLELDGETYIASSDEGQATEFDLGAPLVADGKQIGVLIGTSEDNAGTFVSTASVLAWIYETSGLEW